MKSDNSKAGIFHLPGGLVCLRPLSPEAIEDRLFWNTVDIDWKYSENPDYVHQSIDKDQYIQKKKQEILGNLRFVDGIYTSLEIYTTAGKHIGFINCYPFPRGCALSQSAAIGIIIPSQENRASGYGTEALSLYTEYLFGRNIEKIYLITQPSNIAMRRAACKCGFVPQHDLSGSAAVLHMVKKRT